MKKKNAFFALSITLAISMVFSFPTQAAKAPKISKKFISLCIGDSASL